jgi:hypothetical protein
VPGGNIILTAEITFDLVAARIAEVAGRICVGAAGIACVIHCRLLFW